MIEAYIVRDPQGRVIGMSLTRCTMALDEALRQGSLTVATYNVLECVCENEGAAVYRGYTIKREQVDL
jgi:hypothetical protein